MFIQWFFFSKSSESWSVFGGVFSTAQQNHRNLWGIFGGPTKPPKITLVLSATVKTIENISATKNPSVSCSANGNVALSPMTTSRAY
jgi:hypothetical protein